MGASSVCIFLTSSCTDFSSPSLTERWPGTGSSLGGQRHVAAISQQCFIIVFILPPPPITGILLYL